MRTRTLSFFDTFPSTTENAFKGVTEMMTLTARHNLLDTIIAHQAEHRCAIDPLHVDYTKSRHRWAYHESWKLWFFESALDVPESACRS